MKTTRPISLLALGLAAFFFSCGNDDMAGGGSEPDVPMTPSSIPAAVKAAFEQQYGDADEAAWTEKGGYVVATFATGESSTPNNAAWYDPSTAQWSMTATEIPFATLPEAVRAAFAETSYAQAPWRADDEADMLSRNGAETLYVIDVEKEENGTETEAELYFTADGVLAKEVIEAEKDHDYRACLPQLPTGGVEEWLAAHFPGARIIDVERENGGTEVDLVSDGLFREVIFDSEGNWLRTETEFRRKDLNRLPEGIVEAAKALYPSAAADEVTLHETADGSTYYEVELEGRGDNELTVYVDAAGNVMNWPSTGGQDVLVEESAARFIELHYPGAVVAEQEYDDGYLTIDIFHNGKEKEVRFNGRNEWVDTSWDLRLSDLPAAVREALAEIYAAYTPEEAEAWQTPAGDFYEVELESRSGADLKVVFNAAGNVQREWRD